VVQRGHNRQVVFVAVPDYLRYLDALAEFKTEFGIKVYAYCLMTNHVHLLVGLGEEVSGLGRLMKRVAGRQTRYHNALEGRTGTLWKSRYKSSPVDSDAYLLACVRYIELNPVRARMVEAPEQYPWSSARHHLGVERCGWLDEDPCYVALGSDVLERQVCHRAFLTAAIPEGEWRLIRTAVQREQLTGSGRFVDEVERILGRRIERRKPGRPAVRSDK
jgi:putative transposase